MVKVTIYVSNATISYSRVQTAAVPMHPFVGKLQAPSSSCGKAKSSVDHRSSSMDRIPLAKTLAVQRSSLLTETKSLSVGLVDTTNSSSIVPVLTGLHWQYGKIGRDYVRPIADN